VTCPNPFVAAAAFITNEEECQKTAQVPAGTICMYDCIEGYLVVGSPAIECTDSGFWNESAPRCDILRCSGANLPAPENGYKSGCPHSEEAYGTECILGCDVGFSPMERHGNCLGDSNGTVYWSDTTPTCENEDPPIIVVPPDPVKFAGPLELDVVVDYSEWEDDIIESAIDASPPVVLHLSSINGVAVTGGRTTVFQEGNHVLGYTSTDQAGNENRFSLQLTVKVIRCQALPLPHEGVADPVVGSDDCNVGAVLGSTCKISCDDGFHLSSDEAYFTCMARSAFNTLGEWVGESSQIECFPNQCNLTAVINGYISGCSGVTVDFDTTCQFICQEGYKDEDGRKRQRGDA
ncbi:putative sushi, von Willebrand factor, partial [Apostichopus japonicus]